MRKKYNYDCWYRSANCTQEKRIYHEHKDYVRGKRSPKMLPSAWDDVHIRCDRKCWKRKRKTQYRVGWRGKEHTIYFLEEWGWWRRSYRYLEDYFKEQDIPYHIETIRREVVRQELITREWHKVGWEWNYRWVGHTRQNGVLQVMTVKERADKYDWVPVEVPYYKERRWYETVGYEVTYWTDKRLDLRGYIA